MKGLDIHSSTWVAVRTWAEDQLSIARRELESESAPHDRSNHLRGRIAALSNLLALAAPQPDIPSSNTPYTG